MAELKKSELSAELGNKRKLRESKQQSIQTTKQSEKSEATISKRHEGNETCKVSCLLGCIFWWRTERQKKFMLLKRWFESCRLESPPGDAPQQTADFASLI